jgi:hypothetical protein
VYRAGADIFETTVPCSLDSGSLAVLALQNLEQRFNLVLLQIVEISIKKYRRYFKYDGKIELEENISDFSIKQKFFFAGIAYDILNGPTYSMPIYFKVCISNTH